MNKFVKGQEISKGYFEVFNFPKKKENIFHNFCPSLQKVAVAKEFIILY